MSRNKQNKANAAERGFAWAGTVLLIVLLTVTIMSTLGVQIMSSAKLHSGVANDESMLKEQQSHIHEMIDLYAEEYGFNADEVKATVTLDALRKMNEDAATWWTRLLTEGTASAAPRWDASGIEDTVYRTMEEGSTADPSMIVADLSDVIQRTVFPMRESLLIPGIGMVNERADLASIIQSIRKVPLLMLVLTAAMAGLIALLLGKEIFRILKYYGTAMAAAGMVILAVGLMIFSSGLGTLIGEASQGLQREFDILSGKIATETGIIALALIAAGYCCLFFYRKTMLRKMTVVPAK